MGPLAGLRVLELAGIGPAPYCAMLLADLGADVVQVVRPGEQAELHLPIVTRGRRRVVVDLKDSNGVRGVLALLDRADVVIDPYRPGVTERIGIGPDTCLTRNPRLVYGRMTGWGQNGPWASMAGHDINYIALTGALDAIGRKDGPPQPPLNLLGDFGGGAMFLLAGILAALYERHGSGQGQVVDAAVIDGTASLASTIFALRATAGWTDTRGANLLDTGAPFYDVYETADGGWMAVGPLEPRFFAELVRILELSDVPRQYDQSQWPRLRDLLAGAFRLRTREEWTQRFTGTDACVAPVLSFAEAAHNEQIAARGTVVERDGVTQPGAAPRFSRTPAQLANPAPNGEQSRDVLADWGVAEADRLFAARAFVAATNH